MLERSIRRLHRYLSAELPFSWRIVVADNASTDTTPLVAERLSRDSPASSCCGWSEAAGRALRAAWSASRARVVCYMDVDLSTDLRALLPLVAPLLSGHSDLAIGTRLARGARVVRGPAVLISRSYNHLLHATLRTHFLGRPVRLQGRPARRARLFSWPTSATTAGSSTPSCSCSRSAPA